MNLLRHRTADHLKRNLFPAAGFIEQKFLPFGKGFFKDSNLSNDG